jgi:hypothetical protein
MKEAEKELALRQALYHRELSKLTNSTDRRLDLEMVGFYDRVQCAAGTNQEEARQTMQHFLAGPGSLPLNGNLPASRQAWRAAKFGASERTQSTLNFRFVNYYRTDFGLPDMVAYLQRNGCTDFRYEIQGVVNEED